MLHERDARPVYRTPLAQKDWIQRAQFQNLSRASIERRIAGQDQSLHHALARARHRDDKLRVTRFVIDKTLQHRLGKFWVTRARDKEASSNTTGPRQARPLGLARQAREKHSPISVVDIGESGEPSANRFGEIPSL